jgi:hypothetical protein
MEDTTDKFEYYASQLQASQINATHRVEYEVNGRPNVSFLATMSLSGMFMRSAASLTTGDTLKFRVLLDDGKDPLDIKGEVVEDHTENNGSGARIVFPENQKKAFARLREYFEEHVIPSLEKACNRKRPSAQKVMDLAVLYDELDRSDEAYELYQRGVEANPRNVQLHERLAVFLMIVLLSDEEAEVLDLLDALDPIVEAGLALKKTELLERLAQDAGDMRASIENERAAKERAEREKELQAEIETRVADAVAAEREQLTAEHEKELAEVRERLEAIEGEQEETRRQFAEQEKELGERRENLDAEE